jgi:hypothetical protein
MRSEKQRQASRANGAKSRGPVTADGKHTSSRNATRHGVLCNAITLKVEVKDGFLDLVNKLTDEFQPQTPFEDSLIESMAAARWRLWRIWTIESATLDLELARQNSPEDYATCVALAVKELSDHSRILDAMSRYEVRYERQYLRAHRRLMEVRGEPTPPAPKPFLVPKPDAPLRPESPAQVDPVPTQAAPSLVFAARPQKAEVPNEPAEVAETVQAPAQPRGASTLAGGVPAAESSPQPNPRSQPEQKNLNRLFSTP